MKYQIYNVSYGLMSDGFANAIIAADSEEKIRSLLEEYIKRCQDIQRHLKIPQ